MTKNEKKAAPVLQHQDGQVETGPTFQSGPHLHQQFTTTPPSGQAVKVASFLLAGVNIRLHKVKRPSVT